MKANVRMENMNVTYGSKVRTASAPRNKRTMMQKCMCVRGLVLYQGNRYQVVHPEVIIHRLATMAAQYLILHLLLCVK